MLKQEVEVPVSPGVLSAVAAQLEEELAILLTGF